MEFIENDGGRKQAGYKGHAGDCVIRAIATATGLPYKEVYGRLHADTLQYREKTKSKAIKKHKYRPGQGTYRPVYEKFLFSLGFQWVATMKIGSGCTVHLREDELPRGALVVAVSRHLTCVIDGILHDTYDCSRQGNRCVYGYYFRPTDFKNFLNK